VPHDVLGSAGVERLRVLRLEDEVGEERPAPDQEARPQERLQGVAATADGGAHRGIMHVYTRGVGDWYWIGVLVGLGVAFGMVGAAIVLRWLLAALIGAAAGAVLGVLVFAWPEAVAGAAGGVAGAFGTAPVVAGALRRGGTRAGVALLVGVGAIAAAALAFVPVLGVLEAIGMPGVAVRTRRQTPEKHAGLRTLARD
jgi:hypothetical protein